MSNITKDFNFYVLLIFKVNLNGLVSVSPSKSGHKQDNIWVDTGSEFSIRALKNKIYKYMKLISKTVSVSNVYQ